MRADAPPFTPQIAPKQVEPAQADAWQTKAMEIDVQNFHGDLPPLTDFTTLYNPSY